MATKQPQSVDFVPLLSRGKHRSPRKGACFMEFASYLAGESWSDHPPCTHPLLASLARQVNDRISDTWRQKLTGLVPDVIGLTGTDLRIDVMIARRAALIALPVVAEERQRILAEALVNCERMLATMDDSPDQPLTQECQDVLEQVPGAAAWAQRYARENPIPKRVFRRQTAPAIVAISVNGVAQACVADPDRLLHDLLVGAIHDCRACCIVEVTGSTTDVRPVDVTSG
jgi:hypothetical protein